MAQVFDSKSARSELLSKSRSTPTGFVVGDDPELFWRHYASYVVSKAIDIETATTLLTECIDFDSHAHWEACLVNPRDGTSSVPEAQCLEEWLKAVGPMFKRCFRFEDVLSRRCFDLASCTWVPNSCISLDSHFQAFKFLYECTLQQMLPEDLLKNAISNLDTNPKFIKACAETLPRNLRVKLIQHSDDGLSYPPNFKALIRSAIEATNRRSFSIHS